MRKVVPGLLVVMFGASSAFGARVIFDPAVADVAPGEAAVFQVSIEPDVRGGDAFESVFLLFGSPDALGLSFDYAQTFLDTASIPPPTPAAFGVYAAAGGTDLGVTGNRFSPGWFLPLEVGTLTVQTTGLALDTFWDIMVSSSQETSLIGIFLSSILPLGGGFGDVVPLEGVGTIHVVPEPATLALLAVGGLAVVRRRKKA